MLEQKQTVFWDWNGTLLDDTTACVNAMNTILAKRGMSTIDEKFYRTIFNFPVKDYYTKLGFDFSKESFEDLSVEFISNYNSNIVNATLQPFALEALSFFKTKGLKQVVVSAMEQSMLLEQLKKYGVFSYFDEVNGIDDIYASSKTYLAKNYIEKHGTPVNQIVFIGDTLHDMEVAEEVGVEVILVSNGHHAKDRLQINGNRVINDLKSLLDLN